MPDDFQAKSSARATRSQMFLSGGGEMGELMRAKDWGKTALGTIDSWPQSLLTTLSIILNSKFPMFLFWGPDCICFYNDAYRPSLGAEGKHPGILGASGEDYWQEIWPAIRPLIDRVFAGEDASWSEDQLLPIYRNGNLEDVYWTFSYSPVKNETGEIAGVFVTCSETTGKVLAIKELEDSKNKFRESLMQAPAAMCILAGPKHIVQIANNKMLGLWGKTSEDILGKTLFEGVPEAAGQGFEKLLHDVYTNGEDFAATEVPVNLARGGAVQRVFVNFIFQPFRDAAGLVIGLTVVATEVTAQVEAKLALQENAAQFRNLIWQSPIAMAVFTGPDLIIDIYNEAMIKGLRRRGHLDLTGKKLMDVFPDLGNKKFPEVLKGILKTGNPHKENEVLAFIDTEDGRRQFYLDYECSPLFNIDKSVAGIMLTINDVTEKVESRQKIREVAERLQLATEGTQLATWDLDLVTYEIIYSPRLLEIFGYGNQAIRLTHADLRAHLHPEDRENIVVKAFENAFKTGTYEYESRVVHPDKSIHWIRTQGKVIFDENKTPLRMIGTMIDITASKITEEKLVRLAAIVQSSEDAIISKTLDGIVTTWNDGAERIFGYTAEEMLFQPIVKLNPENRRDEEPLILSRLMRGDRVEHFETQRLAKNGQVLEISMTVSAIKDKEGKIIGASKIARDITFQKQAERIISDNEERLKIIVSASDLGTWELNLENNNISYSDRYIEMLGFKDKPAPTHQELVRHIHKDDLAKRKKAFEEAYNKGFLDYETRIVWEDGSLHWIEAKGKVFYDENNQPLKLIGTSRDITAEKLYKQQLEESEKRFKTVADNAPVMIWMTDLENKSIFLNKCWLDYTGVSLKDGLGTGWTSTVHPDDLAATSAVFKTANKNRTQYNMELRIKRNDGKYRWIQDHAVPRYDAKGLFQGFIGSSVDIQEQKFAKKELEDKVAERTANLKELNEQLVKTNRELEQFAYISSHDLQEPLRKIQTFSEMLLASGVTDEKSQQYLDKISASALRMSNLIRDLLNYSRLSKTDEQFVNTDLNEVLKNIKSDFELLIQQKNAVVESSGLSVIKAIPIQINQLFYNLIGNSLKFSENKPVINISSKVLSADEQKKIPGLLEHESYVHLRFSDNGIGFSQAHAEQIFVIFQRLNDKQKYSGTGIGLAMCKKIVENHHGFISAKGERNGGAVFDIYLPSNL